MALMNAVLTNLRAEMKSQIQAIDPNRPVNLKYRFEELSADPDNQQIETTSCNPRIYQIKNFNLIAPFAFGGSTRQQMYDVEIWFSYPSEDRWDEAAQDDMLAIDTYFLSNPSTVTGCSNRWCSPDKPMRIQDSSEDSRKFYILTVVCYLETTF